MTPMSDRGTGHSRTSKIILGVLLATIILLIVWAVSAVCGAMATVKEISVVGQGDAIPYSDADVIRAAGLEVGMRRRDVDATSVAELIEQRLPYVKRATVKKRLGGAVELNLECQSPKYSVEIAEQTYLLSEDLRVLGSGGEASDVMPLRLPRVKRALLGEPLELYDDTKYITELLDALYASPLAERLDSVDAADRYALRILYNDSITVKLGDMSELAQKLELAARLLKEDSMAGLDQAIIDVSDISRPTVRRSVA